MREIVMEVSVKGRDPETLKLTLELIYGSKSGPKAWSEKDNTFCLHDYPAPGSNVFPVELNINALYPMVLSWLEKHPPTEKQYNGDGSSCRGFSVQVIEHASQVNIKPYWIYYGK